MIEVLFGESEWASMKNQGCIKSGQENILKYSEVVGIPFLLDIGNINEAVGSEYRKNLMIDLCTINGWDDKRIVQKELEEVWPIYLNEIERLKEYASQGESIRFWYSNAPYSICGFYFTCNLLKEYDCKISIIKLPEKKLLNGNIMFLSNWGEVEPEKYDTYLPLEKELSKSEIKVYSLLWEELKEDNSPLRALVNGIVIGVPEDFYDHIIKKEIPDKEFRMVHLIGNILGKYPLGVGDWWYAKRILYMIELGELSVVESKKETYSQFLKKVEFAKEVADGKNK